MIGVVLIVSVLFLILVLVIKKYENVRKGKEGIYHENIEDKLPPSCLKLSCPKTVRILVNMGSQGLKYDAQIYNTLIDGSYICCYYSEGEIPLSEKHRHVDINIHIEKIMWPPKQQIFPATEDWFLVNQELLFESLTNLKGIDKFLCKSHYAHELLIALIDKYKLHSQAVYVGHTSVKPLNCNLSKDYNLFMHAAGQSAFKNTQLLIKVWKLLHKKYHNIRLVLTCKDYCTMMVDDPDFFNDNKLLEKYGIIYKPYFDKDEYEYYTNTAGCYICPSLVEGYGHYINEGRANGAVVITTDGPPMNELVIDNYSGLLIKDVKIIPSKHITHLYTKYIPEFITKYIAKTPAGSLQSIHPDDSFAYLITQSDLYDAMDKYINLPLDTKMSMSQKSYQLYISDTNKFQTFLEKLLK